MSFDSRDNVRRQIVFAALLYIKTYHSRQKIKNKDLTPFSGDYVILQADMDIILVLTACSTEAINGGKSSPLRIEIFDQQPV